MQKNVLNTDLTGKVAVVTGAGGVLCSDMAKTLARAGAKSSPGRAGCSAPTWPRPWPAPGPRSPCSTAP